MVQHLERTDSKDRVAMMTDHDSVSSNETATNSANTCPGAGNNVPKVEIDHCSDGSSSQNQDSDSPPSSPSGYNLLQDTSDQIIKFTPPECMHLLMDRMDSSSSSTQFLKKNETDLSLSLSDDVDFLRTNIPLKCSPSVTLMLKTTDVCFLHWNWPRIRLICAIFFWSIMIALLALAIGLVVTAPRSCQPSRAWWQGAAFYEIFPAAFQDTNGDGWGDLPGIARHLDYIGSLGFTVIRLNAIFESDTYPQRYWATLNHTNVAAHIGTIQDFEELIRTAHEKNLKVVIDFNPIFISKEHVLTDPANFESNGRTGHRYFFLKNQPWDPHKTTPDNILAFKDTMMLNLSHSYIQNKVAEAMEFWLSKHVDGFYMKYIEHLDVTSPSIQAVINHWRIIIDRFSIGDHQRKSLICSSAFAHRVTEANDDERGRHILGYFDLINYDIQMTSDEMEDLPRQLEHGVNETFGHKHVSSVITPWIMWSVGSAERSRLANRMGPARSLATIIVHLMLPGSVNLFYGDEIFLEDNVEKTATTNSLVPMRWLTETENSSQHTAINRTLTLLRDCLHLRNTSTPLLHAFISKAGEEFVTPNYRVRLWRSGVLVLERFYPRSNSLVVLANLNQTAQHLDISSLFYQGKVVLSSHEKKEYYIPFNSVHLQTGEVVITEI